MKPGKLTENLKVLLSKEAKERVIRAAIAEGLLPGTYIRVVVMKAVKEHEKNAE